MKAKTKIMIFLITVVLFTGSFAQVNAAPAGQSQCSSTYLKPGDCVIKSYGNGRLRLRTSPDTSSNQNIIENLEEGTRMTIIDGPYCNSGYLYWKVVTEAGVLGYAAEGSKYQQWLTLAAPNACSSIMPKQVNPVATATNAKYCPIKDCACSNLQLGDFVKVSNSGPNALRRDPDLHPSDNIIYRAPSGTNLQIIDGPYCSYGWLVWKVRTDFGLEGYTPESNGKSWWLIPDAERNSPYYQWNQPIIQQPTKNPWYAPTSYWTMPYTPWQPLNTPTAVPIAKPIQGASGNCALLSISPANYSSFPINAETDFSWTIRNDSNVYWTTDNFDLAYIGGTNMLKRKDNIRQDLPYNVAPGSSLSFILDAVVPATPGIYSMTYGVVQNYEIVCSVEVKVQVTY
mgnify:CR=1 FL=1|jgi:hypothetical protein